MPALSISIDPSILDAAFNPQSLSEPISITGTSQSDHLPQATSQQPTVTEIPELSGIVKDSNGKPLVGATVIDTKNTTNGTVTDLNGKWTLKKVKSDTSLEFTFIGYKTQTIKVSDKAKLATVTMLEDSTAIDEVVVQANKTSCTKDDLAKLHATEGKWLSDADDKKGTGRCMPTKCIEPQYKLIGEPGTKNAECQDQNAQKCTPADDTGVKSAIYEWDEETKTLICVVECKKDYHRSDDRQKCIHDEVKTYTKEELDAMKADVAAAKATEQSLENRMLGAATMAATGAGGQMLASGLAEKKADEEAEQEMQAYLATFQCQYADGERVAGGTSNVSTPGGSALIDLYSEYVTLANDLKLRKEALGIAPGIESEPILDGATSGLYDDAGSGFNGQLTSLARALMDPSGEDAQNWAEQRKKSDGLIAGGAVLGGIGAVGGLVGNQLLNNSDKADKESRVKKQYEKVISKLEGIQKQLDKADGAKCSTFDDVKNKGTSPNCECADTSKEFHPDYGCLGEDDYELSQEETITAPKDKTHIYTITFHSDSAFESEGASLTKSAKDAISDINKVLRDNADQIKSSGYEIQIVGYTDQIEPTTDANEKLSEQRADAIKNALVRNSSVLDEDQIKAIGAGSTGCDAENDSECRRVEVRIYVDPSAATGDALKQLLNGATTAVAE